MFCLYTCFGGVERLARRESQKRVELLLFGRLNGKYLGKLVVPKQVDQACIHAVLSDLQRQAHKLMPHKWRPPSHVLLQVGDKNLLPFGFMYKHDLDSTERLEALTLLKQCMLPSQPTNKQESNQESKKESKHVAMLYDDTDDYATYSLQCCSMEFFRCYYETPFESRAVGIKLHEHSSSIPDDLVVRLCNDFRASHFTVENDATRCEYKDLMFLTKLSARNVMLRAVLPSIWCDFGIVELFLAKVAVPPGISRLVGLKRLLLASIEGLPDTLKDLSLHEVSLSWSSSCMLNRLVTLLADMSSLAEIHLVFNSMSLKCIPSELGAMTSLKRLEIHDNSFRGRIPSELGCLTNLTDLIIEEVSIDTSIPQEVLALQRTNTKLDITFT